MLCVCLNDFYLIPQAVRAGIICFLQQLHFEVIRKDFNRAALQCELNLRSRLENPAQVAKTRDKLSVGVIWWMCISTGLLISSPILNLSFLPSSSFMLQRRFSHWDLVIFESQLRECCFNLDIFVVQLH